MTKMFKNIFLFVASILFLLALVLFLRPSVLLNKNNLVRTISLLKDITYKNIDFKVSSPAVFEKEVKFTAKDLCVKNRKIDLCFPNIAVDFNFTVGWDRIRIKNIKEFVVDNGKLTLNILPAESKAPSPSSGQEGGGLSLVFRAMELFADLSNEETGNLNVKNFSYLIDFRGMQFKGILNIKNEFASITLDTNSYLKGEELVVLARFNDGAAIELLYNDDKVLSLRTHTKPLAEFLEYIASKEAYRYRKKELRAEIDIENLPAVLKMVGYTDLKLKGPVHCKAVLKLNTPKIDDAALSFDIAGNSVVYYFYQKIPKVETSEFKGDELEIIKFLSHLAEKMDYHLEYRQTGKKMEITVSRDYSKLPKRVY